MPPPGFYLENGTLIYSSSDFIDSSGRSQRRDLEFLTPFIDPSLVLLVVLLSVSIPVRMAWRSLMELLGCAASPGTVKQVRSGIEACTAQLPVQNLFVRVIQPGRTLMVLAHVILPRDFRVEELASLDVVRRNTLVHLQKRHLITVLDMIFTTEPEWGALESSDVEA